ncbi:MAG: hypothetical protein FJW27_00190 [Acidimicrobiia bacterium]|nr:hypothetical protein [Acidimicrobiia bacterium]
MRRFGARALAAVPLWLFLTAGWASAQAADRHPGTDVGALHPQTLGFDYDNRFLRDLPLGDSLFALLETLQPSLISDRFANGGLYLGRPSRIGGFQASWSQTRVLIGDVDISDPNGSGAPLLFPDLSPWQRVRVATGLIGSDVNATGLAVTLDPVAIDPREQSARWQHTGTASFSHGGLSRVAPATGQPSIARLRGRDRLDWVGTGLLSDRVALSLAASWTLASQLDRGERDAREASLASAFGSVLRLRDGGGAWRTTGWFQRTQTPFEFRQAFGAPQANTDETSGHVQTAWSTSRNRRWPARLFTAYTQRARTHNVASTSATVERLVDGPVWTVVASPHGTVRQWTLGARTQGTPMWRSSTHVVTAGVDAVGASQRTPVSTVTTALERTDTLPSRIWSFRNPTSPSRRGSFLFAVHASDTVRLSDRLTASAGLRVEAVSGSAKGAGEGIGWTTVLPRARLDWRLRERGRSYAFVGYTKSAVRLALDLLAFGDPAAPWAAVYRWDPRVGPVLGVTPIVARVGPGTGGLSDFVRIDADLARPTSDELSFGFELAPSARSRLQIAAVGRREHGFMALRNLGAPAAVHAVTLVEDPGANVGSPGDDKIIPVYGRSPASFGADRYLLTNLGLKAAYSGSLEISGQYSAERLTFYGGATASISRGPSAALGYGPLENDQSVVSETYISPNADPFRRGRLFNDRAFTIKLSTVYRLPWDVRVGAIARYQDGQNFTRVLVFPTLPQGTEAVRAFAAGDSRFRFIAALDVRLSKAFRIGGRQLEAILDGYNLTGLNYDVEERTAQLPDDRTPIAYQPPRLFHVGLRVSF